MERRRYLEEDWGYLLSFLPSRAELDGSAARFGAIRRVREISSGSALLRLMMAYGFCGMSLRRTAAWASEAGVANLSDVSLLDRFRNGADWLGHVLALKLADHAAVALGDAPPLRVRLIDASTVTRVGGRAIDWRLHLTLNLFSLKVDDVELTNVSGGERLSRFKFQRDDLVIGDAGYAHRDGLESVVAQQADFLVRLNWSNLPLLALDGTRLDLLACCRTVSGTEPAEFPVRVRGSKIAPVRLLIVRKTTAAAAESRLRKQKERSKKGKVDLRTLEASEYVMLLSSASSDTLSTAQVFELYRFRWQIELTFKRLKSLLDFDYLPAKNEALARVVLFAKLLGALLVDDYIERYVSFSPWGYLIRPQALPLAVANH
jgi:hypothetical protein